MATHRRRINYSGALMGSCEEIIIFVKELTTDKMYIPGEEKN
jgi:hypothetical protein